MTKDISHNQLSEESNLQNVMQRLNSGVYGAVFIVDSDRRVIGMFTDGDVRRAILEGASLDDNVVKYMNTNFISGSSNNSELENSNLLSDKIRHIPILDEDSRLVDLISWAEILNLPVMAPSLSGNELKYVKDCVVSGWISSQGQYVSKFEKLFSEYQLNAEAIAVSSGTAALHLALLALGVGENDEVIVPNLTFAATANIVLHCGAKPICVDVCPVTWTIDTNKLSAAITTKTKAIIPVHLFGHPCDMSSIMEIAKKHNLKVIEDCAEAQGATYKGKDVGTIGDVGCFSFFSNKVITTGEGGMVSTKNAELANKIRILRDHGMSKTKRYWHEAPGFNYRMTNLQAAVGVAQMERLTQFVDRRRSIGHRYISGLQGINGVTCPPNKEWADTVFWIFSILIDEEKTGLNRDLLMELLAAKGIETRPFFYPLNIQPPYKQDGDFKVSERLAMQGISLPSGNELSDGEIDHVCFEIKNIINMDNSKSI